MRDLQLYNIKSERYGGGLRWHCTNCDSLPRSIRWTNSKPPKLCTRCATTDLNHYASQIATLLADELDGMKVSQVSGRLLELGWVPSKISTSRLAAMVKRLHEGK